MRDVTKLKNIKRNKRHKRIRTRVKGTTKRPRLSVFRSNRHIYLQIIDDSKGKTIVSASDLEIKDKLKNKKKTNIAFEVGKLIAQKALEKKIKNVCFDRGGYKYHGRVKSAADGAREGGLNF
ncbi:50S ribosomal protein L18 [bacterium]|nr:50S ribosomal protein L18 [bacterium]